MIHTTKLNNDDVIVNADMIELIETTPDTMLTLVTGKKIMVRESAIEIVRRILEYRRESGTAIVPPVAGLRLVAVGPEDE